MRHLRHKLRKCHLFEGFEERELYRLLEGLRYRIATFSRGQVLAVEGAPCSHMAVILSGEVEIQRSFESGRTAPLARLTAGGIFGEVVIFSEVQRYPATVWVRADDTEVMFISREEVIRLCHGERSFLEGFLRLLSDRVVMLNDRIKLLSYGTIRQKVAGYLLDEMRRQDADKITLSVSRRKLAQLLGVTRPALSREMGRMKKAGLMDFNRDQVRILDPDGLEECLFS